MPSDRSRGRNDLSEQYHAVVSQQGRAMLDRDLNALQEIVNGQIAADALDEIGPCGSPDDGFTITLPDASLAAAMPFSYSRARPLDFLIAPGTMYVGGQRVILPDPIGAPWSYFNQPDWVNPPDPAAFSSSSRSTPPREHVSLHVHAQEVGGVEDPDLLDVALGGPDTTQRVRLMRRIERLPVTGTDCASALAEAAADWLQSGFLFDPATMQLKPQVTLQVSFTATAAPANPCDPVAQGGYLGADNQLIRFQIADGNQLLWGYDNASFLYRVNLQPDGKTLVLNQTPVDAFHCPRKGQAVEVLRTAAILGNIPDASDPSGQKTTMRCVAEAIGQVGTVASYSNTDNSVVLDSVLPDPYRSDSNPLFLRVWQAVQAFDPSTAQPLVLVDPTGQTAPGIQVRITFPTGSTATGATLPVGAYWMVAVRPSTPQALYPERFLAGPQPPDGPRQWVCPLAVIDWQNNAVPSCREYFDNLVTLTKRRLSGCCTISVGPNDAPRLQELLDAAVRDGRQVTACLAPGVYALPRPLRLTKQHANLVLEACQAGVVLTADPNARPGLFLNGLIVLVEADHVTFRMVRFELPDVSLAEAEVGRQGMTLLARAALNLQVMMGIEAVQSRGLTLDRCWFNFSPQTTVATFGAGIFAVGDCSQLRIQGCRFQSAQPATSTPLAARFDLASGSTLSDHLTSLAINFPTPIILQLPHPASLFGLLALPWRDITSTAARKPAALVPTLHDAQWCDNDFENLTLAVFVDGDLSTLELQNNRVKACLGGFWLGSADTVLPTYPDSKTLDRLFSQCYPTAFQFTEILICTLLATGLPSLLGLTAAELRRLRNTKHPAIPLNLCFANNCVDVLLADRQARNTTALLLLMNRPAVEGRDVTVSVVLASNHLRGRLHKDPNAGGACLALVVVSGRTSVTGNLMTSEREAELTGDSLNLFPLFFQPNERGGVKYLAVSGNVLIGGTNLGQLPRGDDNAPNPPFDTWLPWNSVNLG